MEKRHIEFIPKCLAVGFKRKNNSVKHISGDDLFKRFVNTNNHCYWNINLKEVFDKCELVGHIQPYCLLINAQDIFIQSLKLAHQKRLLKAPESFVIHFIGDVDSVNCNSITPSQFVSLDEALCYVIFDLNLCNETSAFDMICCRLAEWYPGMQLPPQFLILATLRNLIDAGQVYYTGYGYNIMTNDKMFVAQWLGEQGPEGNIVRASSLSDVSVAEKPDIQLRSKSDRIENTKINKSTETMQYLRNSHSAALCIAPMDESVKRTKTRSAVRQFFAKLRPRHHKSHISSMTTTLPIEDSIYDDDSNYYAFCRSQPRFYSSNLEFSPRFSMTTPTPISKPDSKPQWLWRTSLQSLPLGVDTLRRSSSSHSRLSTQAIHDESPPQALTSHKSHRSKSRTGRHRSKSKHSSKVDRSSTRDKTDIPFDKCDNGYIYGTVDNVQEDSGVHSISGSHGKQHSNSTSQYKQSMAIDTEEKSSENGSFTPPTLRQPMKKTQHQQQRLSRSFSTRLSTLSGHKNLDPVIECSKWDSHDDKHVAFKDPYGAAY